MLNQVPAYPSIYMPFADVRNVAEAHLEAVIRDEADGKRFILVSQAIPFVNVAKILQSKYGEKGYPIKTRGIYKWVVRFGSVFSAKMAHLLRMWDQPYVFDGSRASEILGITYFSPDQSILDMAETLIETGYIEDRRPGAVKKAEAK